MRIAHKSFLLLLHLLTGLALAAALALETLCFKRQRLQRERLASWWSRRLLDIFGIRLKVHGSPAQTARLTVANHVSWLDISVISSLEETRFVSKAEVQDWPVAGWLADAAGAFYIRRGKGGSLPLLRALIPHLRAGGSVTIFPEGTTTDGQDVLDFHPRLFAAAIEAECPVQPVALVYSANDAGETIAPFVGDDDLLSHILRLLACRELIVEVEYFEPLAPYGLSREALARAAHAQVWAGVAVAPAQSGPVRVGHELPAFL